MDHPARSIVMINSYAVPALLSTGGHYIIVEAYTASALKVHIAVYANWLNLYSKMFSLYLTFTEVTNGSAWEIT